MNWFLDHNVMLVLALPAASALLLALLPGYRLSARVNVAVSLLAFLAALSLFARHPAPDAYFLIDDLNIVFIVLNTFVGFTTSVFSASYIGHELETGRLTPTYLRFYHAMYQVMMFGMNLALLVNNIGLMWVAIELATLATVLMVGIYRTHEALEAAWKYFILASVGIAFALFGTILVYMAALPVVGEGLQGMTWTVLLANVSAFEPGLLSVAFVFLFLGYGTKVGLAPLHAWLPDAHAEGPTPISAVLSGLLLNVALYAILRFKMLMALNTEAIAPGPLMVTIGLISLIFAAFMLYRRRDIKRFFAYSSIEHMGIIVFAFGMGGPLANFAGLLQMTMHSLTKSAIFFTVGHVAQVKGTQKIAEIRGPDAIASHAWLEPGARRSGDRRDAAARHLHERIPARQFDLRARALAGHSAGLRVARGVRRAVAAASGLCLRRAHRQHGPGAGILCADLRASGAGRRGGRLSGAGTGDLVSARCRNVGISDGRVAGHDRSRRAGSMPTGHGRASSSMHSAGRRWPKQLGQGLYTLSGLWGDNGAVHAALLDDQAGEMAVVTLPCPDGRFPSVGRHHAPAIRLERAIQDLFGLVPDGAPDPRPWLDHGRWDVRHPLGTAKAGEAAVPMHFFPPRAKACIRLRLARCMPASSSRGISASPPMARPIVRLEARLGYTHKGVELLMAGADLDARRETRRAGSPATARLLMRIAFARAAEAALGIEAPPRAQWLRALMAELERLANHLGDIGAICNDAAFALMLAHCGILRERVLRASDSCFGHRMMRDCVVPGGVSTIWRSAATANCGRCSASSSGNSRSSSKLYDNTASLQDRTVGTGILKPELARQFGAGGYVGRASGRAFDARRDLAYAPYDQLGFEVPVLDGGRRECARLDPHPRSRAKHRADRADSRHGFRPARSRRICRPAPAKAWRWSRASAATSWSGCGSTKTARVARCHLRDPSWFQWPLAGGRDRGEHRRGLPALQQIVQLLLFGARSVRR